MSDLDKNTTYILYAITCEYTTLQTLDTNRYIIVPLVWDITLLWSSDVFSGMLAVIILLMTCNLS